MSSQENLQEKEDPQDTAPSPQDKQYESADLKGMTDKDRHRIHSEGLRQVTEDAKRYQKEADDLLQIALGQAKISEKDVDRFKKRIEETPSAETREDILAEIQETIARSDTPSGTDKTVELEENDPALEKALKQYDNLIDKNKHLLGEEPADEYKKWIREQKPTLKNIESLTVKFLQSERPPRLKVFDELKKIMAKYGIIDPLEVAYIREQGLSERREFLENIKKLEGHFQKLGGMKEVLYSQKAIQEMMKSVCEADDPRAQKVILDRTAFLARDESHGYTTLKAAVQAHKISQKSMKNMLDFYKDIDNPEERSKNLKLWENFIEAEASLTDKLKEVFDAEPKNEQGFKLAFQIFKDLDYPGKEKFIEEQTHRREEEKSNEKHNKELTINAFKHACTMACENGIISESTEENYHNWIDENAKGKTLKEITEFHKILTSSEAQEQNKNLKAYEKRQNHFNVDLRRLRDVHPTMTDEEFKEWQTRYDCEGWKKREKIHGELGKEIQLVTNSRELEHLGKLSRGALNKINRLKEGEEGKENSKTAVANKETALAAIQSLVDLKAYGTAMKYCARLLRANPFDEDVLSLIDEIARLADHGTLEADAEKEDELYKQYTDLAHKKITGDADTKVYAEEIQSQEQALKLTRKDQEQRKKISAHDRNEGEVLDTIKHDKLMSNIAKNYLEDSGNKEIINTKTLKGEETVRWDFKIETKHEEKREYRKKVHQEQVDAGDHKGSSVTEFEDPHTGRILDARSGGEAEKEQRREKQELAKEMAEDITGMTSPAEGENIDHRKLAKKAALDELQKKADTKIERLAA